MVGARDELLRRRLLLQALDEVFVQLDRRVLQPARLRFVLGPVGVAHRAVIAHTIQEERPEGRQVLVAGRG